MATITAALTETLNLYRADGYIVQRGLVLNEVLIVRGALEFTHSLVLVLRDRLKLSFVSLLGQRSMLAIADAFKLKDRTARGVGAILRSTLALRGRMSGAQATRLRETLRLALSTDVQAFYTLALRQALTLTDRGPTIGIGAYLHARVALQSTLSKTYHAVAHATASLGLTSLITPKLMVVVLTADDLNLSGSELLRLIYTGQLQDTVDFVIDLVDPSGDVTTWAMNVRTGAVTEYMNYGFNALAPGQNGAYIGADSTGLYELVGIDDHGSAIVADMISGLADFSGGFLTGFKAAYLGIRGVGQFYLKLTDGGGKTYLYGVQADNLRTTRVNLGKGLRARYFTFELISTGQDFDLLDVRFLPIQQVRRT